MAVTLAKAKAGALHALTLQSVAIISVHITDADDIFRCYMYK
jgi:hypothetical protein